MKYNDSEYGKNILDLLSQIDHPTAKMAACCIQELREEVSQQDAEKAYLTIEVKKLEASNRTIEDDNEYFREVVLDLEEELHTLRSFKRILAD